MAQRIKSPFKILEYNSENLAIALKNKFTSIETIKKKFHYKYFLEYLDEGNDSLQVKSILIERNYISKSYLVDYSQYYSTCFKKYPKTCSRIHFFTEYIDETIFKQMISENAHKHIWDSYAGYVVIKPLPDAKIGATIIKTYNSTNEKRRHYPCVKEYTINIFGKQCSIKSLAFMEQDEIVSACATTALWSAFHKVSQLFQTPLPSPIEITRSAQLSQNETGRTFPSIGLDLNQIAKAIDSVGLVAEMRNEVKIGNDHTENLIKALIYSYLRAELPVLLGVKSASNPINKHLITITGYKERILEYNPTDRISLKANQIEQFYAHDDQTGPFSRISFINENQIQTEQIDKTSNEKYKATIVSITIPVHPEIRITFEDIHSQILALDSILFEIFNKEPIEFVWDIYLSFSNQYKIDVREGLEYSTNLRKKLLFMQLPKYIWVAKCTLNKLPIFDLIYDATAINTADDYCLSINIFHPEFNTVFKEKVKEKSIADFFREKLSVHYINLIEDNLA